MAKYINKEDLIELLEDGMPIIDIVNCNNCKHLDRTICLTSFPEQYRCKLGNGTHRLDFFCKDARRRGLYD